jgi:hypothetical protein
MSETLKAMNPNDMAEDQLVQWLEMTPPEDVLLRVGEDATLAERVLAAEKSRKPASARRKDLIEGLEQVGVPPAEPKATKADKVTPPGTVWLGEHHVEVGSAAYDELLTKGFTPSDAPKDAEPLHPE